MSELVKVHTIYGGEAELYRMFFESLELDVMIVQESVGQAFGLTMGLVGEAHIYAHAEDVAAVEEALQKLDAGEYELEGLRSTDDPMEQESDPDEEVEE
ncbi:MAG TPA: hypothetical protein VFF78_04890 [Anaerolineaceae bacterium]|nr:hypothetical protein [Anaerolineaceae bacterium]